MNQVRLIAIPCEIFGGVVPDERAFEITLADHARHSGVSPVHYLWNQSGDRLKADEPGSDEGINGRIAARLLERENGTALVSIPDGSVVRIHAADIKDRPSKVVIDVPIGSRS